MPALLLGSWIRIKLRIETLLVSDVQGQTLKFKAVIVPVLQRVEQACRRDIHFKLDLYLNLLLSGCIEIEIEILFYLLLPIQARIAQLVAFWFGTREVPGQIPAYPLPV